MLAYLSYNHAISNLGVVKMAVQKSRKSKAKAKSRRTKTLGFSQVVTDPVTGERVMRHHVTKDGFYKGKSILQKSVDNE